MATKCKQTHELGLFQAPARPQPRGNDGKFIKVKYSPQRLKVRAVAREMRARLGLPPSPYLEPPKEAE